MALKLFGLPANLLTEASVPPQSQNVIATLHDDLHVTPAPTLLDDTGIDLVAATPTGIDVPQADTPAVFPATPEVTPSAEEVTPTGVDVLQADTDEATQVTEEVTPTGVDVPEVTPSAEKEEVTIDTFYGLTLTSLRKLCKVLGVPTTGNKVALVERVSTAQLGEKSLPAEFDHLRSWYSSSSSH